MKNYVNILLRAILAGLLIGLAGTVYLSVKAQNQALGALLFSFGLLTIVNLDYKLYTGRVAYLIDEKASYILDVLCIILGNLIGTAIIGFIVILSNQTEVISQAEALTVLKLNKDLFNVFFLSISCGVMMYLGVEGYKRFHNPVGKVLAVIFAVVIFILAGFEHSIANMFYFVAAKSFSFETVIALLVMILGNGVGAVLFNLLEKYAKTKQ